MGCSPSCDREPPTPAPLFRVDVHDLAQESHALGLGPLEAVAADDRAESAAVADRLDLLEDLARLLRLAAREDHDAPAVERAAHDVADAVGQRLERNLVLLEHLLRLFLGDVRRRRLDLHDVRAEEARDLRRVRDDVDGRLALLVESVAARIAPDDDREPLRLRLFRHRADLGVHLVAVVGARVDGEADRRAARRSASSTDPVTADPASDGEPRRSELFALRMRGSVPGWRSAAASRSPSGAA